MSLIFRLFRRSPFPGLQEHFAKSQAWDDAVRSELEIVELEEEADELKRTLRLQLPKDIFLPVSRNDLLQTLHLQDGIANTARDIARLAVDRRMELPEPLRRPYLDFLQSALKAVDLALVAVNELDELVETGFRGTRVARVEALLEDLDHSEAASDQLELALRDSLRGLERQLYPVDVMFLYQLIEWTGALADQAQRIGHRLTLMVAR